MKRALAALLCAALAACGGGSSGPPRLVIAIPAEPMSLNTLLTEGPTSTMLDPLVYSFLLTIDDRGRLVPDLAVEVPSLRNGGISHDGRTIVYHLRKHLVWQDGYPLTAADVVFTQHAIVNSANNVFSRYGFDRVKSIEAIDAFTVRIRLNEPYSPILTQFFAPASNYGVVPAHLLERFGDVNRVPFNAMPIGSGPYRVKEWARGDHITLVANPSYFRGRPALGEIVLKFVPDSATVLNQLRTGETNAYFYSDPAHLREYASIAALRVTRAPFAAFGDLFFNMTSPAVASPAVRRALVEALDLPAIVRNATRGTQTTRDPNFALFGTTTDPSIPPVPHNPAAARAVLKPLHLSLDYLYETGKAASAAVGLQLQQQLRDAGVDANLRAVNPTLFRAPASAGGPMFAGKFQIGFFEVFSSGDGDPSWYLSCAYVPPNGFNVQRFCDPIAQRAMNGYLGSFDPAIRQRNSTIVQRRVADLVPFVSLWSQNAIYVTPRGLHGFSPSPVSPYWNVWAWSLRGK